MNLKNYYFGFLVQGKLASGESLENSIIFATDFVDKMIDACPFVPEWEHTDFVKNEPIRDDWFGYGDKVLSEKEKDELFERYLKDTIYSEWISRVASQNDMKDEAGKMKCSILFKRFLTELHQNHEIGKGLKEIQRHFIYWIKKNKEI